MIAEAASPMRTVGAGEALAIEGGRPVRDSYLPYGRQWVSEQDIDAVAAVLRGDWLTQGPKVAELERAVAEATGAAYGVAVANGTAALHTAIAAAGVGPGDEVITSPLTFVASANAALYVGAEARFADIDPRTGNIDPEAVERAITPRTRAIVGVDFAGHPCDWERLSRLALAHGVTLIADGAHSLGASCQGRPVGSLADMTAFSFHPVKLICAGEGGMLTTNSGELARRAANFRTHGITRDPGEIDGAQGGWYYEMQSLGFNYRLSDMQCALALSQLGRHGEFLERRRAIAAAYDRALGGWEMLEIPWRQPGGEPAWHLYAVRLNLGRLRVGRREVFEALRAENIGVQVHYIPVHLQPYYRERFGFKRGDFPRAEQFYEREISLPIFAAMSGGDVDDAIDAVRKVLKRYRR
jgi:UDP-4-amino-4,6-dideoxy-N-acetyl-beta-L-altrosamine transaminase